MGVVQCYQVAGGVYKFFKLHVHVHVLHIGNGEISFQEFMTTLSVASRGSAEEKLHWTFRMYDINGNGTISRSEATEMIKVTLTDLACRTLQAVEYDETNHNTSPLMTTSRFV